MKQWERFYVTRVLVGSEKGIEGPSRRGLARERPRLTVSAVLSGAHVPGTRSLGGVFALKGHGLPLAELVVAVVFHSASVKKEFLSGFRTDETESAVCLQLYYLSLH